MNLWLQMLKSFNLKRTSHVWDARNYQLDQYNNARPVKDFTVNIVLELSKEVIHFKKKLSQRLKEEKREIEQLLLQPLKKKKRLLLHQKFKFRRLQLLLTEKQLNQRLLSSKLKKRKLLKTPQFQMLLNAATKSVNQEPSRHFQLVVSSETSWTLLNSTISAKMKNIRIVNSSIISNKIANITNNSSAHPKIAPTKNSWPKSNWRNTWPKIAKRFSLSASFAKYHIWKISWMILNYTLVHLI